MGVIQLQTKLLHIRIAKKKDIVLTGIQSPETVYVQGQFTYVSRDKYQNIHWIEASDEDQEGYFMLIRATSSQTTYKKT